VSFSTPPGADEFEISIIGPGRGECVLIHLGDNEWCIVDSCVGRGRSESAAVDYLSSFGNGALERVRMVVATHWHDDHIRGLASILEKIPTASFFCSQALDSDNFFTLVGAAASAVQGRSGVGEFASILGLIAQNAPTKKARILATPRWAIQDRTLLHISGGGRRSPVTIKALSPSDATVTQAFVNIAHLLPKTGEIQRRITNVSPNRTSVVLWIEVGPLRALLGADLEHTDDPGQGWTAVLESHYEPRSATFFKVPHHGSKNADCPEVWRRMLVENPIALVTPFTGARLPRGSDLTRLSGRTTNLYCTVEGTGGAPKRDAVVEKTMRRQVKGRRIIEGQPGHVRVRRSLTVPDAGPVVDLFHGAYKI
jgi:Metallo-beta-lactamase superfamily